MSLDPSNAAAHRFLSDTYLGRPRREIARVSELLQAQLLQDININPVQPSLSETNLNVFTRGGPARPGFNEFTPLFERNQAQLNVSGEVGTHGTWADEAVVSGLYDRFSISGGQFHSETDGFRRNSDLQQDIYNLFAQAAVTPRLNVQGEVRRRETGMGDRSLNFDPNEYRPVDRVDIKDTTTRLGLRAEPAPGSTLLVSLIHNDRNVDIDELTADAFGTTVGLLHDHGTGFQGEVQYLLQGSRLNVTAGAGKYDIDFLERERETIFEAGVEPDLSEFSEHTKTDQRNYYIYS